MSHSSPSIHDQPIAEILQLYAHYYPRYIEVIGHAIIFVHEQIENNKQPYQQHCVELGNASHYLFVLSCLNECVPYLIPTNQRRDWAAIVR